MRSRPAPALPGLALLLALALALAAPSTASAAPPECASRALYLVAHQDDSLLFQSPDLLQDIQAGRCVRTVFLTAGDNGEDEEYWRAREEGAEAGYAEMAGAADEWESSTLEEEGREIRLETLEADPRVSLVFMRLPDGHYPDGEGTARYGFQSLKKLWNGGHPPALPAEAEITAVDGSASYEYQDLIDTLAALMSSFEPQWIATQNEAGAASGDHPDHVFTAKFSGEAQALYARPHQLIFYEDYETASRSANVFGELLEAKEAAFFAYGEHDEDACSEGSGCSAEYENWLERQYVAAIETIGDPTPEADAGPDQSVASGAAVVLDGSQSENPYQQPLEYEWAQTAGPAVALSDPSGSMPSFTAPAGPASLAFSLVVANPLASSAPATVAVTVAPASGGGGGGGTGSKPDPVPGAPPSAGPTPPGNGPGPPGSRRPRLSRAAVELHAGRPSRHVVSVLGPSQRLWCTGRLPQGVRRRVVGTHKIVIEGTRRVRAVGVYRLVVHVAGSTGTTVRKLAVRVLR